MCEVTKERRHKDRSRLTSRKRRHQLAQQRESFLDLILRSMSEVVKNDHIRQSSSETLSVRSVSLLIRLVSSREDSGKDLVERVDHSRLEERERNLRRRLCGGRESLEEMSVGSRSEDGRSTGGSEELVESLDELDVEEGFEVVCSVTERLDGSKNGERSLFDETLVWVAENISEHREDVPDHVERVLGDASKTVGGGGDGCSLDVG